MGDMTWIDDLRDRFRSNADRVGGLVAAYDALAGDRPGRPDLRRADLLRSAVVFLHATLEDLLRSVAERRLPVGNPAALDRIPLTDPAAPDRPLFKFTLADLAAHRGYTVDEVITASVSRSLEFSNYNNVQDVAALLRSVGLDPRLIDPDGRELDLMMTRRHLIVHRADRVIPAGRGHHATRPISRRKVEGWQAMVERFAVRVFTQLSETP